MVSSFSLGFHPVACYYAFFLVFLEPTVQEELDELGEEPFKPKRKPDEPRGDMFTNPHALPTKEKTAPRNI